MPSNMPRPMCSDILVVKYALWITQIHAEPYIAWIYAGLILGLRPANKRYRYKVTPSHIGWVQAYNQPYIYQEM